MIEIPWRQCVHGARNWAFPQTYGIYAVGPLREGGRIVEVRFRISYLREFLSEFGFFVCGTGDEAIENVRAGTPIMGNCHSTFEGVSVAYMRIGIEFASEFVFPCSVRLAGGPRWVLTLIRKASTEGAYAMTSVSVEGVDRTE